MLEEVVVEMVLNARYYAKLGLRLLASAKVHPALPLVKRAESFDERRALTDGPRPLGDPGLVDCGLHVLDGAGGHHHVRDRAVLGGLARTRRGPPVLPRPTDSWRARSD
ncbi:hypothetical protein AB0G00_12665 [Nocardia salmonicida]|uniref:hypothetical protein n=1 Tax=Nocardia salmonicida TaxID=53431 RepID=UPI0033F8862D